jgi:hexokinase
MTPDQLKDLFILDDAALETVAARFKADLENGLAGKPSSLNFLNAYLQLPSGKERGDYLALDFGGTNVRATQVSLNGSRGYSLLNSRRIKLREAPAAAGTLDLTAKEIDAEILFDYIAREIVAVARQMKAGQPRSAPIWLGHTFSFPYTSRHAGEARLTVWTKEIATSGVVGQDVNALLTDALKRQNALDIRPAAVLNDTTATLLSGAYLRPNCLVGSIMGTGHNSCYMQSDIGILNLESGNFNGAFETLYDQRLDQTSEHPRAQLLEKKCAGHYLGEIVRSAFVDLASAAQRTELSQWLNDTDITKPWALGTDKITQLLKRCESASAAAAPLPSGAELMIALSRRVITRSARLIAATFLGILDHLGPPTDPSAPPVIAVDGSLYEKTPGHQAALNQALTEGFARRRLAGQWPPISPQWIFIHDGSSLGAALAACQHQS